MKKNILYVILLSVLTTVSCSKAVPDGFGVEQPEQYSSVYIGRAFHGNLNITLLPHNDTIIDICANYGGILDLRRPTAVYLEAQPELVEEYNSVMHTSFRPLPMKNYILENRVVTINAGKQSSEPMHLHIDSRDLPGRGPYMLPISITSVTDSTLNISQDLKTLYIVVNYDDSSVFHSNYERIGWSILDVSSFVEGQEQANLLDGDVYSYWTCSDEEGPHYFVVDMSRPILVHGISITARTRQISGLDYHYKGQPRSVKVSYSSDNKNWTSLDNEMILPFGIQSNMSLENYVYARFLRVEVKNTWITKYAMGTFLSFSEFNVY